MIEVFEVFEVVEVFEVFDVPVVLESSVVLDELTPSVAPDAEVVPAVDVSGALVVEWVSVAAASSLVHAPRRRTRSRGVMGV
ncbi:MAG: hypothetical protein R3B09_26280 [Nannocystaceae bacterium]